MRRFGWPGARGMAARRREWPTVATQMSWCVSYSEGRHGAQGVAYTRHGSAAWGGLIESPCAGWLGARRGHSADRIGAGTEIFGESTAWCAYGDECQHRACRRRSGTRGPGAGQLVRPAVGPRQQLTAGNWQVFADKR